MKLPAPRDELSDCPGPSRLRAKDQCYKHLKHLKLETAFEALEADEGITPA